MNSPLIRRLGTPALVGTLVGALVLTLGFVGLRSEQARYAEEVRSETITVASRVRADLEKALEARIFVVEGLAGFAVADLAADGDIDAAEFERYATSLEADSDVPLRSLQLAPEGVVTYVYPLAGNEEAIGHDLLEDPARRAAVLEAVELRKPMVAGPFELLQGGVAIVVRKPVFESTGPDSERWWGLATMLADIDPLYAEVGIEGSDDSLADYDIALRGRDQSGAAGDVFFGDAGVFDGEPVAFDVTLPSGSWQLAMLPAGGWDAWPWPRALEYELAVFALALLMGWLTWRYAATRSDARRAASDLSQLVETASAPIAEMTLDGTIVLWNHEMVQLTGVRAERIVGAQAFAAGRDGLLREYLTPDSYDAFAEVMCEGLGDGDEIVAAELKIERVDGTSTPVLANVAPKQDARGVPTGIVAVFQDMSARVEAEQIKAESAGIERAARLKDEFLASMSHELRTPLNGIIGLSSILGKETFGPLNDKQHEYVGQIASSGKHLLSLINDVLDLAKIEAQKEEVTLETVDLVPLVEEAAAIVRENAKAKGLRLVMQLPDTPVHINGDPRRLKQVALNLLSNAVKFTDEGSVTVRVQEQVASVRFEVEDTGIGIPKEQQHLLFQPFQQVDAALNRNYGGTGLGLALTAKLVELHDGAIAVSSEQGRGARFRVTLPLAPRRATTGPEARATVTAAAAPAREHIRVVLAEDNDVNRMLLTDVLESSGIEVIAAIDGIEAVERTTEHRPDVVLMDIQMPRRDGLEATRLLKAQDDLASIPIIAVTALAMEGDAERCMDAGCDAYLSKPVEPHEVVALVRQFAGSPAEAATT